MAERGVLYMVWGDKIEPLLDRSMASLKEFHPELPVEVVRFDGGNNANKTRMVACSPFRETLFLDADTVVMGKLDFGFEMAARAGLACCINENPWAARYRGLSGDAVEYNTGVLFYTEAAKPVLEAWKRAFSETDATLTTISDDGQISQTTAADQGYFAAAMIETRFVPFVLPLNWNFRPRWHRTWFGPIRIWHDHSAVWAELKNLNAAYRQPGEILRFHEVQRSAAPR